MVAIYRAQVHLVADSGIPADVAVNTWHFEVDQGIQFPDLSEEQIITGERPLDIDENGIHGDLSDFYEDIGGLLAEAIDPNLSYIKWFNLGDPKPSPPRLVLDMDNFTTTGTSGLPSEVAIVSSFEADPVQGVNQQRRRNRVYLGPLSLGTVSGPPYGHVPASVRTTIAQAMSNFAANSGAQSAWTWCVRSSTTGETTAVDQGWVDNAWDTQRRRGIEATDRTTWREAA